MYIKGTNNFLHGYISMHKYISWDSFHYSYSWNAIGIDASLDKMHRGKFHKKSMG